MELTGRNIEMKNLYYILPLTVACLAACQNKDNLQAGRDTRDIEVNTLITKTTIDYEGDVSHLVWSNGDNVMYLTDDKEGLEDYGFQSAAVKDNRFTASIPASATKDNKILIVWPGRTLDLGNSSTTLRIDNEFSVSSKDAFDGRTLPMVAVTDIPEGSEVSASFQPLGAVLRIAVDSTGHASERLKSITLTTAEQCAGTFKITPDAENTAIFSGNSNTVKVSLNDTPELRNFNYIYMVLAKGSYTGVKMEVETEATTYAFEDGTMDLTRQDRGLYRISVSLPAYEEPKEEAFVKVTSADEITADAQYLILSPKSETEYYALSNKKDMDYIKAVTVTLNGKGAITKDEDTEAYAVTFITDEAHAGKFALKNAALGKYCYLQHPNNVSAGVDYKGYFWFGEESELATTDNCWWTVTLSGDNVVFTTNEFKLFGEATGRFGEMTLFKNDGQFGVKAPETDAEECAGLVLFKLQ